MDSAGYICIMGVCLCMGMHIAMTIKSKEAMNLRGSKTWKELEGEYIEGNDGGEGR